jgi:hypothetical protein
VVLHGRIAPRAHVVENGTHAAVRSGVHSARRREIGRERLVRWASQTNEAASVARM